MENQKFLSEEKYQQNNAKVKRIGKMLLIIGIIILVLGIIFIVVGFLGAGNSATNSFDSFTNNAINNFNSFDSDTIVSDIQNSNNEIQNAAKGMFGSIGLFAIGGFMETIGFILTVAGGIMLFIAHRREITAYAAQQMIPVGKEIVEEVAPTIGNAAGEIAKGIKKGINDANNEIK